MIIKESQVMMHAEHERHEHSIVTQVETVAAGGHSFTEQLLQQLPAFQSSGDKPSGENTGASVLVMTEEGFKFRTAEAAEGEQEQLQLTRARLFQLLLDAINFRRKSEGAEPIKLPDSAAGGVTESEVAGKGLSVKNLQGEAQPIVLKLNFSMREQVEEYECSQFHSCGLVKTADGREIDFSMSMTMERHYSATREYRLQKEVVLTDPLILNFEGDNAQLANRSFAFDLDLDGDSELISYLDSNSAFLALDNNGDGLINDGSELFGAVTGDGFAELAAYDEDGNNYIDEADSIYSDLLLWTPGADQELQGLASRDVGAIYLGATETPFQLKNSDNALLGQVRSSGFYLTEEGEVGSVQQIDMAV